MAPVVFQGTVRDEADKPVAGAEIRALMPEATAVVSDAEGRFTLPIARRAGGYMYAVIEARHPDGRMGRMLVHQETEVDKPLSLVVKPPRRSKCGWSMERDDRSRGRRFT